MRRYLGLGAYDARAFRMKGVILRATCPVHTCANHLCYNWRDRGIMNEASKRVSLFRANVSWAPLGAQLVPRSVFENEKYSQSAPKVPRELKITSKSDTEGP